ncbi:MAG TPA: YccF domain-containing protein [Caulobacter sp.]|nr:YccF domain-containing protein [Caulobacter sp.]
MIRLLLNILWFVMGGWISGLLWLLGGLLLAITVVGLPYTGAAWRVAGFAFWPFGKEIVPRDLVTGREDLGTGPLGCLLNLIWFVLGGWYIALSHLMIAVAEAVTIIGIPFAIKDLQLAVVALAPIGRTVVVKR